jgi:hypothetical protein
MKKIFFIICLAAGLAVLPSCQKCTVCTYIDQTSGEEVYDEYCGSEKQVSDYETDWTADWIYNAGYCLRY